MLPLRLPALTGRTSLATVFGYEWLNDGKFGARVEIYQELQKCTAQDVDCLNYWAQEIGRVFLRTRESKAAVTLRWIQMLATPQITQRYTTRRKL